MVKNKERTPIMPDIQKLRAEFKTKYGDTKLFDYFYFGIVDRARAETERAIIKGRKKINIKWIDEGV